MKLYRLPEAVHAVSRTHAFYTPRREQRAEKAPANSMSKELQALKEDRRRRATKRIAEIDVEVKNLQAERTTLVRWL